MANSRRLDLDNAFRSILGSKNVYFRAPESKKMNYPAIKYKLSGMDEKHADNFNYLNTREYEVIHIGKDPDTDIVEKMLNRFDKCRFVRRYEQDNLIHDVFYLYW